jgi:uncharacterized protein YggE
MEEIRTVRVTGRGQLRLRPDTTRITMTLSGVYKEYADALAHAAEDAEALKDALLPFGFARTDLRTLQFHTDAEYEGYDDHGVYKNRFVGYRYRQVLKVEFASDNARLGRMLYALAHAAAEPELSIEYFLKDAEAAKNLLLERAVADAKEKAELLAKAAGVQLSALLSIDYSWGNADFVARPMARNMLCKAESADRSFRMDVEPDDIEANDTVTVVWTLA